MEPESANSNAREERLQEILVRYVDAREQGHPPDPKEFTARYPEFAGELEEYFAGLRQLDEAAAPLRELVQPPVARQLGDFRLLREVGRGGMGIVHEAEQISLDRRVALKVLPFASMLDSKQLQRFKNEAHAAAQLHHQNIVPVYAVGCERGVHYFAMQFIEGRTLDVLLRDLRRSAGLDTEETPAPPPANQQPHGRAYRRLDVPMTPFLPPGTPPRPAHFSPPSNHSAMHTISARWRASASRPPRPWSMRTSRGSSIATSSRQTCWWTIGVSCGSPISAWLVARPTWV